jgi:pentatricopeptide repeat protein
LHYHLRFRVQYNVINHITALQQRMHLVEQFVAATSNTTSSLERIAICKRLLEHQSLDVAVRVGDCYNTIIETYASDQSWNAAYEMITAMQQRGFKASQYVTADLIAHVCKSIGLSSTEFLAPAVVPTSATKSTAGTVHDNGNTGTDAHQHDDDEIEEDNIVDDNDDDVIDDGGNSDDDDRYAHK